MTDLKTVHRQTVLWGLWARAAKYICLSARLYVCLSVCESVCLSKRHIALGLKHNFSDRGCPSQSNPNWSIQRKYEVVIMAHPSYSGSEQVCPIFQGLLAGAKIWLHICLSATSLLSPLLTLDLFSLITILYMLSVDKVFCVKAYTCNRIGLCLSSKLHSVKRNQLHMRI